MSRRAILITFPIILLFAIYFLGPEPDAPVWSPEKVSVPSDAAALEQYVAANESKHELKPDNEARIIWAGIPKKKTEFSVVYLHGFSASQEEGDPVHEQFARKYGCNLYLARMADHGIDTTEALINFTPDRWWQSSKEALAIGQVLGEKVIIMSTSTGGTMAIMLAAAFPTEVYALVNMSPNIALKDPMAWVANNPWGLQLARIVKGSNYNVTPVTSGADSILDYQYWNHKYRLEAVCQLEEMLESGMTSDTFERVTQPCLTLYYYKNEMEQDNQVDVAKIVEMSGKLSTPSESKVLLALPNAGGHVLGSRLVSKDLKSVMEAIDKFAEEKLGMIPVSIQE